MRYRGNKVSKYQNTITYMQPYTIHNPSTDPNDQNPDKSKTKNRVLMINVFYSH